MKQYFRVLLLGVALLIPLSTFAGTPTDVLGGCLVDHLNGKERKNLAKWIFFSMAAHPEIKKYLNASPKNIVASDKFVGALISRLLTKDCAKELKSAYNSDPKSVEKAFGLVGRVAMRELMSNQNVMKALTGYVKYADQKKINGIIGVK